MTPEGHVKALNLGYDWCAEHEWGIKEMEAAFGVKNSISDVIADHAISVVPLPSIHYESRTTHSLLVFMSGINDYPGNEKQKILRYLRKSLKPWGRPNEKMPLGTAWDSHSFGIMAMSYTDRVRLKELAKAIKAGDASIYLGDKGANPFARCGLVITVLSKWSN
jgi:hypothetical protein